MSTRLIALAVGHFTVLLAGGALYVKYQGVGGNMTQSAEAFVETLSEQQRERTLLR